MLYLIEILHQTTTPAVATNNLQQLYLIEILHQTTTPAVVTNNLQRCILSKFYIKPQQWRRLPRCCCVVSYRNSTSNHNGVNATMSGGSVVSYRNSTSNHNEPGTAPAKQLVVSYRNSTSNHNSNRAAVKNGRLYLIEILHQTTTFSRVHFPALSLYLIEILHQTTTRLFVMILQFRCILSKFYIKPQLVGEPSNNNSVVSYRNSTSNHNYEFTTSNYP